MTPQRRALLAIALSLLSALFFTATYVFNRAAAVEGGHWAWTAALRYLFVLPLLLPLMRWVPSSCFTRCAVLACNRGLSMVSFMSGVLLREYVASRRLLASHQPGRDHAPSR